MYLLDTNACIRILNDTCAPLTVRLGRHAPEELKLCSIVKAELLFGACRSSRMQQNLALLHEFFAPFECLPFDDGCAEHYAKIRANLTDVGTPIGPHDLMIAATAAAHRLTMVTHNTREFSRVAGLAVEDWELPEG